MNLTTSQEEQYLYRHAMGHYITWLQVRWPELRTQLRQRYKEVYKMMTADMPLGSIHLRLPRSITLLYLGLEMALEFAKVHGAAGALDSFVDESGDTDASGAEYLLQKGRRVLIEMAKYQGERVERASPTKRFLLAFNALMDAGDIYLDDKDAAHPKTPELRQRLVGWDDSANGLVYLHNELVYKEVCGYFQRLNELFVKRDALCLDLLKKGIIRKDKKGKSSHSAYIPVLKKQMRVLIMSREYWCRDDQPSMFPEN